MNAQQKLDAAKRLASIASDLDYQKVNIEGGEAMVDDLHQIAFMLAGARVGELYAEDDAK